MDPWRMTELPFKASKALVKYHSDPEGERLELSWKELTSQVKKQSARNTMEWAAEQAEAAAKAAVEAQKTLDSL